MRQTTGARKKSWREDRQRYQSRDPQALFIKREDQDRAKRFRLNSDSTHKPSPIVELRTSEPQKSRPQMKATLSNLAQKLSADIDTDGWEEF